MTGKQHDCGHPDCKCIVDITSGMCVSKALHKCYHDDEDIKRMILELDNEFEGAHFISPKGEYAMILKEDLLNGIKELIAKKTNSKWFSYMDSDEYRLASMMHDNYEFFARKHGWETQKTTRVNFEELPEKNRNTMIDLAKFLINTFHIKFDDICVKE